MARCAHAKRHRRARTQSEFRGICRKIQRLYPEIAQKPLAALGVNECEQLIEGCFSTARQKNKGQVILHGIFAFGLKRQWCYHNPVEMLEKQPISEGEIELLRWEELKRLLCYARMPQHRACLAALGLMLWAGVRPKEVSRLEWVHIDWEERVVIIPAQHAKTGGCRHVSLGPALRGILHEAGVRQEGKICPADWGRRWKRLREAAGLIPWRQDVLRHCFASYHVKKWHDYGRLQAEMGHRSAELLRTRYLSMRGISTQQAQAFWKRGAL